MANLATCGELLNLYVTIFSPLLPSPHRDTSLELDFDALNDEDELSDSGEHKTSSLSGGSPSPPLPSSRGFTDSGTSHSNLDTHSNLNLGGSRDSLMARPPPTQDVGVDKRENMRVDTRENGVSGSKDSTPMSPTGGVSISLRSLDLDFDFPSSFGLGTISKGRSLMNIPTTMSQTSRYDGSGSTSASSGQSSTQKSGMAGLQRSNRYRHRTW